MASDLGAYFETGDHSDVTLVVEGVEIPAHRFMLCARSKYFGAMFKHDMHEKKTGTVEIKDVTAPVFRQILRYIYTGICEFFFDEEPKKPRTRKKSSKDEKAAELSCTTKLLIAADHFELRELVDLCADNLAEGIDIENAAGLLAFADLYSAKTLKLNVLKFFKDDNKRVSEVMDTDGFKALCKGLVSEILTVLVPPALKTKKKRARDEPEKTEKKTKKTKGEASAIDVDD
jgi:speckle-type POZ protein